MSSNQDLLRRIEQLEKEKKQLEKEKEQVEEEKEESQRLVRKTTLEEYLKACQEHVLSKVHLVTDGYLTTRVPSTNPARKHCPTLVSWDDFIPTQADMIERIDRIIPRDKQLFESLSFLETMGERIDAWRVQDEASLALIQHNTIEVPVQIILSKCNHFHDEQENLDIPSQVEFQTTASNLRDTGDERSTVERDARLRTDQICVFRNSAHEKDIAYVIEYKAPRKLHTAHFEQGLRQMNIAEEVVSKQTIPTAEPDRFKHYAELLSAAAVTQTYHYMLEAGLEYGYLTNGDAIVFLNIDWDDPTRLRYHLARPSREVSVDQDTAWSNAVCQVLAFTMIALQSRQHSNDERVAAATECEKWTVDFNYVLAKIIKEEEEREEEEREKAGRPSTPTRKKHRRVPSSPDWQPTPVKRSRRNPRQQSPPLAASDRLLRSHGRRDGPGGGAGAGGATGSCGGDSSGGASGGGAGAGGGSRGHSTAVTGSSRSASGGGSDKQEKRREYCTSSCLLSLVAGRPPDNKCPNVALHRDRTHAEHGRHPVSYAKFMDLLKQQLSQSLDKSVKVLGIEGACGALFQITLLQFGYTFIAKGVTGGRVLELEKEVAVYRKLQPLQGRGIPVCLGSVDLKPLGQVYFYDFDVRIIRFILLSYGGKEVRLRGDESRAHTINTVTSIICQMHNLGVVHGDVRQPNVLQGPDGEISLIDFDRAKFIPAKSGDTLSAISANKRRRLTETEGDESSSPKKTLLVQRAIQEDNGNAQSLFSLDCGRIIGQGE